MSKGMNRVPLDLNAYTLEEQIGKGAGSTEVWQAHTKLDGRTSCLVALKIVDIRNVSDSVLTSLTNEAHIMIASVHTHIIPYYGSFVADTKLHLVMKLLEGSVFDFMRYQCREGFANETLIATILYPALMGLGYLHANNKMHRDIKAANILIDKKGVVVIADFGVATMLETHHERHQTFVGTLCWMAPEMLEQLYISQPNYNYKVDVWSFGITAIELALGRPPNASYSHQPMRILQRVLTQKAPTLKSTARAIQQKRQFSPEFRDLVKHCVRKYAKKRPDTTKLCQHAFFKKRKRDGEMYILKQVLNGMPSPGVRYRKQMALQKQRHMNVIAKPISFSTRSWDFENDTCS